MNKISRRSAILAALIMVACGPKVDPTPTPPPTPPDPPAEKDELTLSDNIVNFTADAGTFELKVTASGKWTAKAINDHVASWLTLSPTSGDKGTTTVVAKVAANDEYDERNADYEFACGTVKKTMRFVQKQKNAILLTSSNFEVAASGETITVEVKANVSYTVTIDKDCSSWVKKATTKALETKTFQLAIAENTEIAKREGKVTVSGSGITETITIYQSGATPSIVLSQGEFAVPFDGGNITVKVSHNVDVTAEIQDGIDWITTADTKAMSTNEFVFYVYGNQAETERSAKIAFVNKENGLCEMVTVIQEPVQYMPDDEVWYQTKDGKAVSLLSSDALFDVNVISSAYVGNHGVLKLSGPPTTMKNQAFMKSFSYQDFQKITSFQIPSSVRVLEDYAYYNAVSIKEIVLPEGVETIGESVFFQCDALETVTLPSTLKSIGYAAFYNTNIKRFLGPSEFIIMDGMAVTYDYTFVDWRTGIDHSGRWISKISSDVVDIEIPSGVVAIDNAAARNCTKLKSIYIPSSVKYIGVENFLSSELEYIGGPYASSDNRCYISYGELQGFAPAGLKSYRTPSSVTSIGSTVFAYNKTIEEIVINDEVTSIGMYAFQECPNLKNITLPASLTSMSYDPFYKSTGLENIYVRSLAPPSLSITYTVDFPKLSIHVPEEVLALYQNSPTWEVYRKYLVPKYYEDITHPDYYFSSDFSSDGRVKQLQAATEGNGINIVLMGDAFSDRQIADGTYDSWMTKGMESFFSVEPYKSFRHLFNVYSVDVVSGTEGFSHGGGSLGTVFGQGTFINGDVETIKHYAFKAVSESKQDDLSVLVIPNKDCYGGTCTFIKPATTDGFAQGLSICWVPATENYETFSTTLNHEMGGHGFGKLQDEYCYAGTFASEFDIQGYSGDRAAYGWYTNFDFTTSEEDVYWSKFLKDSRFDGQGLGIFEGANFEYGAYRPTEYSIMRYNVGGYNAPSRETIYKRIMYLAYGSSWTYDFEEFVKYDQVNKPKAVSGAMRKHVPAPFKSEKDFVPLARPVVLER